MAELDRRSGVPSQLMARWTTPDGAAVAIEIDSHPRWLSCRVVVRTPDRIDIDFVAPMSDRHVSDRVSLGRTIARATEGLPLSTLLAAFRRLNLFAEWTCPSDENPDDDWLFDG